MVEVIYQIECKKWVDGAGWSYSCTMDTIETVVGENIDEGTMLKNWMDKQAFEADSVPENGDFCYFVSKTTLEDEYPSTVDISDGVWLSGYLKEKGVM